MRLSFVPSSLKFDRRFVKFEALLLALALALVLVPNRTQADTGMCSGQTLTLPFNDVMGSVFFCFIAQIYFQGITTGTSPNTYSPTATVTRDQMAAFLSRVQNSTLNRGSRRAALNQFWTTTPHYTITAGGGMLGTTTVGNSPRLVASDGADLWVANNIGSVSRVRASDGKLLETWTSASSAYAVLAAMGRIFVTGDLSPGRLYMIDPSQTPGVVTTLSSALGNGPQGIAFDGQKIWTANSGSVSIITPGSPSFTVTNVMGFGELDGILYDGANIWVTEANTGSLKKLDSSGGVIATVNLGTDLRAPVFDGTNIWVPIQSINSIGVVRPSDGTVLATLSGNGLNNPYATAFDGQRIMVTNSGGSSVSLFRATDFAPLGSFSTGSGPLGVCSDGVNFWITLFTANKLARF